MSNRARRRIQAVPRGARLIAPVRIAAHMGLVLAVTLGLVIWIVIWALGFSGLDSGLLALAVMLVGASGRVVLRNLQSGSGWSSR